MRKAIKYTVWVVGALTLLWLGYTWAVPEPADILPDTVSATDVKLGDRFMDAASANLDSPVLEGNSVELLVNGNEIFPAMIDAIDRAEESVSFLTYVYWTGDIANRMADALARAAERDVEVRVLLDAFGAKRMSGDLTDLLERSGVQVAWFHPLRWYHLRTLNNRTHRKVLVVDGRIGFTGGVGIAEEWQGDARHEGEWRDNHFRLRGPVVRQLQGAFAENWRDATGEVLVGAALLPELGEAGSSRIMTLTTSPTGDASMIAFLYWLALQTAVERIDIATPYFVPDPPLSRAIRAAAERGIRIRLLVPGELNDSWLARSASLTHYEELLGGGVEIYEFQPSMMHVKSVLVDDRWAIIGSANMDNRSFELNDEIVLLVQDSVLVSELDRTYERDLANSRQIEIEEVEGWSPWRWLKSRIAMLLREQL